MTVFYILATTVRFRMLNLCSRGGNFAALLQGQKLRLPEYVHVLLINDRYYC